MTNDSWWGVSEGHKQLLSYAKLRAIETRREIARAANSGISAHINARNCGRYFLWR
jgi:apolipoprotein N-acyltransferase